MVKNLGAKPYVFPQPVLIIATYDESGVPNAMNAAWGGIVGENEIMIDLSEHKTTENLRLQRAFTVSIGDREHVVACDYVGIVSGKKVPDKLSRAGFSVRKSEHVNAPIINELPLTLECRLKSVSADGKYLGEIVGVLADERILGEDGEVDLGKFHPITYDPARYGYYALGEKVGQAFSDGKKLK